MVTRRPVMLLIVAMLLIVMGIGSAGVAIADNTGTQLWNLDTECFEDVDTCSSGPFLMELHNGPNDNGQSGSVAIPAGGCMTWISDQAAGEGAQDPIDVVFSDGTWVTRLKTPTNWVGDLDYVEIGEYCPSGPSYNPFAMTGAAFSWGYTDGILDIQVPQGETNVVHDGCYLYVKVCVMSSADGPRTVDCCNGCSDLASPCPSPGWPTPEIAAGVLFGLGLIGLLGYVGIRRMRNKEAIA